MDIIMNGDPRQINYAGEDLYAAYCETVDYGYAGVVWFKDRDVGIERVGHRLRIWGKWVAAPPGANLLEHSEYEVLPVEKWEPLR